MISWNVGCGSWVDVDQKGGTVAAVLELERHISRFFGLALHELTVNDDDVDAWK